MIQTSTLSHHTINFTFFHHLTRFPAFVTVSTTTRGRSCSRRSMEVQATMMEVLGLDRAGIFSYVYLKTRRLEYNRRYTSRSHGGGDPGELFESLENFIRFSHPAHSFEYEVDRGVVLFIRLGGHCVLGKDLLEAVLIGKPRRALDTKVR